MTCKLGRTDACKAREHGCASECPALPWQPADSARQARAQAFDAKVRRFGYVDQVTGRRIYDPDALGTPAQVKEQRGQRESRSPTRGLSTPRSATTTQAAPLRPTAICWHRVSTSRWMCGTATCLSSCHRGPRQRSPFMTETSCTQSRPPRWMAETGRSRDEPCLQADGASARRCQGCVPLLW